MDEDEPSRRERRESEAEKLATKSEYCLKKGRMGRRAAPRRRGGAGAIDLERPPPRALRVEGVR